MIYVYQNSALIPPEWLAKVTALHSELLTLENSEQRKGFIDSKKAVWGEIKDALLKMSHGKCWYSEAPDAVSDWHVDHYRPKGRALDEDKTKHEGYSWLAFDWKNYRIAGSYPNSPHTDEVGEVRGKWDYFPLVNGSIRATWANQDIANEVCLILDPTKKTDPKLVTFDERGLPISSDPNNAINKKKVDVTVNLLYLDSPRLVAARKKKWRDTNDWIMEYRNACPADYTNCTQQDAIRIERLMERLREISGNQSAYASTARACLRANGLDFLISTLEDAQTAA